MSLVSEEQLTRAHSPLGARGGLWQERRGAMAPTLPARRTVLCGDALEWLSGPGSNLTGVSFITSLPDVSELSGLRLDAWKSWFKAAAQQVLSACGPEGVAIFFQTDIRKDGAWVDKGYLVQRAAEDVGATLLWHRVVCRARAGTPTAGRPAYSHLLCFSRGPAPRGGLALPDVLPSGGAVTWTRGMGVAACELACRYVLAATSTRTVVDPFCGHGTVLAVANALGLSAVGVEKSPKRVRKARSLEWRPDGSLGFLGEPPSLRARPA